MGDGVVAMHDEIADIRDALRIFFLNFVGLLQQFAQNGLLLDHVDIVLDVVGVNDRRNQFVDVFVAAGRLIVFEVDQHVDDGLRIDRGILVGKGLHRGENQSVTGIVRRKVFRLKGGEGKLGRGLVQKHRAQDDAFGF